MIREGLTFDDVLLVPQYSEIESRTKDVDLSVNIRGFKFKHPIIPANMQTVTGPAMAEAIIKTGGLAILHRFMNIEQQYEAARSLVVRYGFSNFAVSLGVKSDDIEHAIVFYRDGVRLMCIDIAHGDSKHCIRMIKELKNLLPEVTIIAGNVATGEGARRLWEAGADIVKVGVGPGSLCTTRIQTGNGVPQLTALMDVAVVQGQLRELERSRRLPNEEKKTYPFIADGGIKDAGDFVKALCFADMVMAGNLFAGCKETPGLTHNINGICYKDYVGSSTHKTNHVEGVKALVPCKGTFEEVLGPLVENISSGCSYQGSHNLTELKDNPVFIRITNAGLKESHPHDVIVR